MSLRLCFFVDRSRAGLFRRLGKTQRKVRAIIMQEVIPNISVATPAGYLPEHYPWCFIISSAALRQKCPCIGAFMVLRGEQGEELPVVIYSAVSHSWLENNMHTEFPLTFWASRVLNITRQNDLLKKDWQPLAQWVKALRRSWSPWREFLLTPSWRFKNQSQMLLREGAQEDYRIHTNDGVDIMPWKNWPACIQQEAGIWIWRQSRHRNILDSQRILLRRAEAKSPDASF